MWQSNVLIYMLPNFKWIFLNKKKNQCCFSTNVYPFFFFDSRQYFTEEAPSAVIVLQVIVIIEFPPVVTARLMRLVYVSVLELLSVLWHPCRVTVGKKKKCFSGARTTKCTTVTLTKATLIKWVKYYYWEGGMATVSHLKSRVCGNCSVPFIQ